MKLETLSITAFMKTSMKTYTMNIKQRTEQNRNCLFCGGGDFIYNRKLFSILP